MEVGDTVKVNRYDSDPFKATVRVSYELAEVVHPPGRQGAMWILWKTGQNKGKETCVMANCCEVVEDIIQRLGAIPDASKIKIESWSDRDDVTSSD
jgi:hypothetical protein